MYWFWTVQSNVFLFFIPVPSMTSNNHAHNSPHVCTNHTILMHKDKAKSFSSCKHCDTDTNQSEHTTTNTKIDTIKDHGETNQTKMSCNSVQSSTRTYNYILTHINKQTYFSPGLWQISGLLIYRECWVWSKNMPEIFYTNITLHMGCWYEHSRI